MLRNELPVLWVCTSVTLGVRSTKSWGVWIPLARMSLAVNALTETGLSNRDSERFRAVTTTSSRGDLSNSFTGEGSGDSKGKQFGVHIHERSSYFRLSKIHSLFEYVKYTLGARIRSRKFNLILKNYPGHDATHKRRLYHGVKPQKEWYQ